MHRLWSSFRLRPRSYLGMGLLSIMFASVALVCHAAATNEQALEPLHEVDMGNARFLSGGVGALEREAMFARVSEFDLLVSFARKSNGSFLSGVDVVLQRDAPHPFTTDLTTAGPLLFARVPEGHYKLTASLPGWSTVHREVDVTPRQRQRLYITLEPTSGDANP